MTHPCLPLRGSSPQRGAAILTALLLMALVATLSASAMWQQARTFELERSERTRVQANWILQGSTDWARLILREDARSGTIDHLGEPWAITLQEAKLSTFLSGGAASDESLDNDALHNAYLSGSITDLQSRLNVTNLVAERQIHPPTVRAFSRLFTLLQLPQAELQLLTESLRSSQAPITENARSSGAPSGAGGPLTPRRLEQLRWLGLSERTVRLLQPYVVVLPERSAVNLNTAPSLVLQAAIPTLDASGAQRLIELRTKNHFRNLADAAAASGLGEGFLIDGQHSVKSSYFEVRTRLRMGSLVTQERTGIERKGLLVKSLWKEREAPPDDSVQ